MSIPNALLICCAILRQPKRGLRRRLKRLLLVQFNDRLDEFR